MPRKKTVIPDEPPMEALTAAESGVEENAGQFPEDAGFPDTAPSGEYAGDGIPAEGEAPSDGLPSDVPAGEVPSGEDMPGEAAYGDMPSAEVPPTEEEFPADALPSDAPWGDMPPGDTFPAGEENPFLQELGETGQREAGGENPLTLDPPPGEDPAPVPPAAPAEMEGGMDGEEPAPPRRPRGRPRRTESTPAADPRRDRVLTIEARDEVQTAEEREAAWHLLEAVRARVDEALPWWKRWVFRLLGPAL